MTKNLEKRLNQHNNGQVTSTKHNSPYQIIYTKTFDNRKEARDYEKFLKIRYNKEKLLREIS